MNLRLQQRVRICWARTRRHPWRSAAIAALVALVIHATFLVGANKAVQECEEEEQLAKPPKKHVSLFGFHVISERCGWRYLSENEKPLTVIATLGLFTVTGVLAWYTAGLWRETKRLAAEADASARIARHDSKQTRKLMAGQRAAMRAQARAATSNAEAAKAMTSATIATEQAVIVVSKPLTESTNGHNSARPGDRLRVHFINLGKTLGRIAEMDVATRVYDSRERASAIPAHIDNKWTTIDDWLDAAQPSGEYSTEHKIEKIDADRARTDQAISVLMGRVRFSDVFGNTHETGFIYEWASGNKLTSIRNDKLNYTRPHKPTVGEVQARETAP